jgi:hypothetical protein
MGDVIAWEARGAWECDGTARLAWNNGPHGVSMTAFVAAAGVWHMRAYKSGAFLAWLGRSRADTHHPGQKCAIRIVPSDGFLTIGSDDGRGWTRDGSREPSREFSRESLRDWSQGGFTHTVVVGKEGAVVHRWGSGAGAEAILIVPCGSPN